MGRIHQPPAPVRLVAVEHERAAGCRSARASVCDVGAQDVVEPHVEALPEVMPPLSRPPRSPMRSPRCSS